MIVTETIYNTPESWDVMAKEPLSWQAAMWSKEGQEARFHAIRRRVTMLPGDTLLDFGCGTGRLHDFVPAGIGYFGYDWSPAMRSRARRDGRQVLDGLGDNRFDHVIACGTFNLADSWSKDGTWSTLLSLWNRARRTLAVSLYRGKDPQCLLYDPTEAANFARSLTKRWQLDASYLDNDLLVVLHR